MKVKLGDKVVQLIFFGGYYVRVKTVNGITPNTISVCDRYKSSTIEMLIEPRQHPEAWRCYEEVKVKRMQELVDDIKAKEGELRGLYHSLPKIEL